MGIDADDGLPTRTDPNTNRGKVDGTATAAAGSSEHALTDRVARRHRNTEGEVSDIVPETWYGQVSVAVAQLFRPGQSKVTAGAKPGESTTKGRRRRLR